MENNSFSKNSIITFLTEILIFIFGFIILVIITRILGPEKKGIYSLILLVPALIINFGSFGIGNANVYFIGSKKYKIQDIASNSLLLAVILGGFLIIVFWILIHFEFFKNFIHFGQLPSLYLWIVVLSIPISLLFSFFQNIVLGTGKIKNYNMIRILQNTLWLVAVFLLLVIFKRGVFGAVFSYIFSIFGVAIFTIALVRKITKFHFSFNKGLLKELFNYGGKAYIANTVSFLNYRFDMFLIVLLLNPAIAVASVGIYSIAVAIAEKLFIIPGALSTVLFPTVSSMNNGSEANDLTSKVVRHTFFIMFISSLLLFFLAKPLITIVFGSSFASAALPLMILLPGIVAFSIGGVIAADLSGRGKPQFAIYSSLACLITNIILNIIFIPKWGISGAAFASAISYWMDTIVVLIAFLKISKKPLAEVLLVNKEDLKDYIKAINNFRSLIKNR